MEPFATIVDMMELWRNMSPEETSRAEKLLQVVSNTLRAEADKVGKNLDEMIKNKPFLSDVAKSVTVDVVARALMTSTSQEPMTQMSESAMGYTMSATFLSPGGGLFIKQSELARLGLKRQKYGVVDFYGDDQRDSGCSV